MAVSLRRYDWVVAVSTPIAESLRARGVRADRIRVIPNAWEPNASLLPRLESRRRLGLRDSAFTIGWVGRFVPEKGSDVIANAMRYLNDPGWQAALVGDGPEWKATHAIVDAGGFAESVSMPGAVPAVSRLLSAFDVFVLSSRTEGTPIALLEAMSAEVPVVATAVGGIPDVIGSDEGLLVPPDDPRSLARAIDLVRSDQGAAAARAVVARATVRDRFNISTWCESYSRVYRSSVS
jgi:glycosyltransferase involved in cell wall biosynthesis